MCRDIARCTSEARRVKGRGRKLRSEEGFLQKCISDRLKAQKTRTVAEDVVFVNRLLLTVEPPVLNHVCKFQATEDLNQIGELKYCRIM